MVIFGATGDLTARKLIPALYNLAQSRHLTNEFAVVGVARKQLTADQFRTMIDENMKKLGPPTWTRSFGIQCFDAFTTSRVQPTIRRPILASASAWG